MPLIHVGNPVAISSLLPPFSLFVRERNAGETSIFDEASKAAALDNGVIHTQAKEGSRTTARGMRTNANGPGCKTAKMGMRIAANQYGIAAIGQGRRV